MWIESGKIFFNQSSFELVQKFQLVCATLLNDSVFSEQPFCAKKFMYSTGTCAKVKRKKKNEITDMKNYVMSTSYTWEQEKLAQRGGKTIKVLL